MPLSPFAFALLPPLTIMTIDVDRTHSTFDWVCSAYMRYGLPLLKRNAAFRLLLSYSTEY